MKAMSNAISLVLKPHEMVAQQDLKDCAGMQSWDSSKGAGHIVSGQDKHLFASPGSNGRIWFGLCFQIETSESILPSDTPPVVIISYLNGTLPIKQPRGLLIQG